MAKLHYFFAVLLLIATFPTFLEGTGSLLMETTTRSLGNGMLSVEGDGNIPCNGFCLFDLTGCEPGCGCLAGFCRGNCCP